MFYNLLNSHTVVGKKLDLFHDYSLFVLIFISFFVFSLLVIFWVNSWVFDKFLESKITEFLWTSFPGVILLFLLIPSIHGLYNLDYLRLTRVKMKILVSGRQWYWSFKFLPRVNSVSMCSECQRYFNIAEKGHFWFHTGGDPSNMLVPFWWKKVRETYFCNTKYYINPLGINDGLRLPYSISSILFGSKSLADNLVNYGVSPFSKLDPLVSWIDSHERSLTHRSMFFHPSCLGDKIPESEYKGLYRDSLFWGYSPLDRKMNFSYNIDSYMSTGSIGYLRNLDSDLPLVLPTHKLVRFFFWSSDVIHSFAVPELSVKLDCVPGRLNSSFAFIRHVGKYFGQCSEMCGANHSFMPVSIESYYLSSFVCLGKHYVTDYDYYWDSSFVRSLTIVRLLGVLGFWVSKFLSMFMSDVWDISYEEALPATLCPGCVWFRKFVYGVIHKEPMKLEPRVCKLGDPGPKGWDRF